jgi:modification methylase
MIVHAEALRQLKNIKSETIDLIITSPPYNKGHWSRNRNVNNGFKTKSRRIEYGDFEDNLSPEEYEKQQREIITECLRVLKPSGSLFYNHIDILSEHQTIHPKFVYDFPLKQIIIWNRKNTPKLDKSYFFPINEYIFWIQKTKTSRTFFNRKKAIMNKAIWELSPDTKNKFPAPFPVELPLNCIRACCPEGGVVLDPFMGSGTTGVACKMEGVEFIGIDINREYCEQAEERIRKTSSIKTSTEEKE